MKINPNEGHPAMDYAEHERTYKLFIKLTLVTIVERGRADGASLHLRGLRPPEGPPRSKPSFCFRLRLHGR